MFFNLNYIRGDNSVEGFKDSARSLEERTREEVEGVIRVLQLPRGAKILDLPCGYGRHSIELALRGYDVTGIDLNDFYLTEAVLRYNDRLESNDSFIGSRLMASVRSEASTVSPRQVLDIMEKLESPKIQFLHGDMRKIDYRRKFDALINMFYSFGFFDEEKENLRVMKNFYRALKSDGQFILHTDVSPEMIASGRYRDLGHIQRRIKPTRIHSLGMIFPSATLHIRESYDPQAKRIHGNWCIEETDGTMNEHCYSVRIFSADEFVDLCCSAGFRDITVYGGWDKKSFSGSDQEMIIHAKK